MTLRVWSDHPAYKACSALTERDFVEITGEFYHIAIRTRRPEMDGAPLTEQEKNELLQGPAELRAKQAADWDFIVKRCAANCRSSACALYAKRS